MLSKHVRVSDIIDGSHKKEAERYSWLLFLSGSVERIPVDYKLPDLSDISMIEENLGGDDGNGGQPPDSDWFIISALQDMYPDGPDSPSSHN